MADLRAFWARLVGGLWFIPSGIVAGAILLALGMVELSAAISSEALTGWPRIFGVSPDGARSMLAGIAGSMITVAGVTFSITMVAVTQASSQYTPRILRNFMGDRANQVVLGIFVGIFAYCLVVLQTIRAQDDRIADNITFVPSLAVLLGVLLAILGIAVLIFFVHHIATTLQASEIIARITHETVAAVDRLFPDEMGDEESPRVPQAATADLETDQWRPIASPRTGYIQRVDEEGLMRLTRDCRLVVRLEHQTGDFVITGLPLGWLAKVAVREDGQPIRREDDRPVEELLAEQITIGNYRTIDQDARFGVRQLVDIALKALSPASNDTTTAVTCVDHLGAILARTTTRLIEPPYPLDHGRPRVIGPGPSFESMVQLAFDEVRQSAGDNVSVLACQLSTLEMLAGRTPSPGRRAVLLEQVALIQEAADRKVPSPHDRERLHGLARRARVAGGAKPPYFSGVETMVTGAEPADTPLE